MKTCHVKSSVVTLLSEKSVIPRRSGSIWQQAFQRYRVLKSCRRKHKVQVSKTQQGWDFMLAFVNSRWRRLAEALVGVDQRTVVRWEVVEVKESKLYSLLRSTLWTFQQRGWNSAEILRQPCVWPSEARKGLSSARSVCATTSGRHSARQQLFSPLSFISGPGRGSATGNELQPAGIGPQASQLINSASSSSPVFFLSPPSW